MEKAEDVAKGEEVEKDESWKQFFLMHPPLDEAQSLLRDELVELYKGKGMWPGHLDQADMRRWLVAYRFKKADTIKALDAHLKWCEDFQPQKLKLEDFVLRHALIALEWPVRTKSGHQVLLVRMGRNNPSLRDIDEIEKLVCCYLFDMVWRNPGPQEQIIIIQDLGGFGMRNADKEGGKRVVGLLQNNFPERMGASFVCHPPWYFRALYGFLSMFMDVNTKKKIHLLTSADAVLSTMKNFLDTENLPISLGGTYDKEPQPRVDLWDGTPLKEPVDEVAAPKDDNAADASTSASGEQKDEAASAGEQKDEAASAGEQKDEGAAAGEQKDEGAAAGEHKDEAASIKKDEEKADE